MRIKHIEIKGYHSIDFTGVAFPVNEIAAFIGKNSAGKSNVLEALDLFFNGKTLTPEDYYQRNTTQNIVITVSFELEENDQFLPLLMYANDVGVLCIRKEYTYGAKQPEVFILGSMIFKGTEDMNPTAKHSLTNVKKYIQKSEIKQNIQQTDAGFHFEAPTVDAYYQFLYSYWSTHIDQMEKEWDATAEVNDIKTIQAYLPAYYYLPVDHSIDDETKNTRNSRFQAIYNHIVGDIGSLSQNPHISAIKDEIDKLYRESGIEQRREEFNRIMQDINLTESGIGVHLEFAQIDVETIAQRSTHLMVDDGYISEVGRKGHGVQREAILRLLQAYLKLRNSDRHSFVLAIDEPELYMHPTYKRALYASFIELTESGCQVMYTTHDPAFVSVGRFDDIHIVKKQRGEQQHTEIASSSLRSLRQTELFYQSYKKKKDDAIRAELQHKCHGEQNEGFFADRVIIVEGATELYALPKYCRYLGFDLDRNNTAVISAESVTLIATLSVIFSALQIPSYCIFDGDKPKEERYQQYLKFRSGDLVVGGEEKKKYTAITNTLTRNSDLIYHLTGTRISEFQETTITDRYAMWQGNFENSVHELADDYPELQRRLIQELGIKENSKPLIAAAVAEHWVSKGIPEPIRFVLSRLIESIKKAKCVPLSFVKRDNVIVLQDVSDDESLPVYSCAAGRNTIADADMPIAYAKGNFPSDAAYLIHIQGDSMENLIPDGSYVAVRNSLDRVPGKIHVCMIDNGEMVCKKYITTTRNGEKCELLTSQNRAYREIEITESMNVRIRGQVIQKKQEVVFYWDE